MVIVVRKGISNNQLQVPKIDDHAVLRLALNSDFDFISMAVHRPTLRVTGQKMRAVDILGHSQLHAVRIAQARGPER